MTTRKLITGVEFWYDPGFTESSVEVPSSSASLGTADLSYDDGWNPSTDRIFTSIELKEEYADLMNVSYAKLTYEFEAGTKTFYAWVDSVALKSDVENYPMTVITFHIDLWRTFFASAEFGYGMVLRRPSASADPPQSLSYRYRLPGEFTSLAFTGKGKECYWVILTYSQDTDSQGLANLTKIQTAIFPISKSDPGTAVYIKLGSGGTAHYCLRLADLIDGTYATKLGIAASTIASVFISPVPPFPIESGVGTSASPYVIEQSGGGFTPVAHDVSGFNTIKYGLNVVDGGSGSISGTRKLRKYYSDGSSDSQQTINRTAAGYIAFFTGWCGEDTFTNISGSAMNIDIQFTLNGNSTDFVFKYSADDFIRENLAAQGISWSDLVSGDKFTVSGNGRFYSSVSESVSASINSYGGGTVTIANTTGGTGLTELTFNGTTFGGYYYVTDSSAMPWVLTTYSTASYYDISEGTNTYNTDTFAWLYSTNNRYFEHSQTLSSALKTTDLKEWIFTDLSGQAVGSVPWGLSIQGYTVRTVISSTAAYLEYRFGGIDSHSQGTCYSIALPSVDLTSNSWSEYVYSGQRDYDIEQRKIAREQALVQSVTGSSLSVGQLRSGIYGSGTEAANAVSEAGLTGARAAAGVGAGLAAGVGAGIAAGAVLGLASGAVDYAIQGKFNEKLQSTEDTLRAKQLDSITLSGVGWDWMWNGRKECGFISMVPDDYSIQRYNAQINLNGVSVSEPTSDCSSLISAGGPLQISNLNVHGDIPIEAKRYIKRRLAEGVRII